MPLPRVWFERDPAPGYDDHLAQHVTMLGPAVATPDDPFSALIDAKGIVAGALRYTADVMDRSPTLLVIGRIGIGVDTVDLDAATQRGIAVCNAPDAPTVSTAEHATMLMLASAKRIERGQTRLRQGAPDLYGGHHGLELAGKHLGLIGFGRIARRVAAAALAMDMTVAAHDPYVDVEPPVEHAHSLEELAATADVISVHIPLTGETRGIFDDEFFAGCKRGAVFVNTARGGLVDQAALIRALDTGQIMAAGLDVTDPEPLPVDHPLLQRDDVVVTPHIATATDEGRRKNFEGGYFQVLDVLAGRRPQHLVNVGVWPDTMRRLEEER